MLNDERVSGLESGLATALCEWIGAFQSGRQRFASLLREGPPDSDGPAAEAPVEAQTEEEVA